MKETRVLLATAAGCALVAASVRAAATSIMEQTFSTTTSDIATDAAYSSTWSGTGSVAPGNKTSYAASAGQPMSDDSNGNVLTVSGKVTATAETTADNVATVDMMVQIAKPYDALELPSSEAADETTIQIAVGVETDGKLKAYCTSAAGAKGWYSLGNTEYVADTWHRVSFTFDYTVGRCLISVDGVAAATENGYVTADGTTTGGAWYKLANVPAAAADKKLSSVSVVGSTSIDSVVVKYSATASEAMPALADGDSPAYTGGNVTKKWLLEQGISDSGVNSATLAPDNSGMTLNGKYVAGYTAVDNKKFELQDMELSGENAVVKFNPANIPAGYKYVIEAADNPSFSGASATDVKGTTAGSATISMGSDNVKYYRIKVATDNQ